MADNQLPKGEAQDGPEMPPARYAEAARPDPQAVATVEQPQERSRSPLPDYTLLMRQALEGRA
ncbi:hypothetical protein FHX15_005979 [Rhizobium sp. BK650]|uniref:hypothetical protein n=1 Tax=Rhizobium sp. BK650 TaxID=2586990 RepID=UPI0016114FCA|nr:hypothetical protein [Rhizobium sp. BK650]MBB3660708.1 hypothetical protein [Rhizobium sp. BK650]